MHSVLYSIKTINFYYIGFVMSKEAHPYAVLRGHQGDVQALTFDHSETHLISGCAIIGISRS